MISLAKRWIIESEGKNFTQCPICLSNKDVRTLICDPCFIYYINNSHHKIEFIDWIYEKIKERLNGSIK